MQGKSILGFQKTYYGMFRGRRRGRVKERSRWFEKEQAWEKKRDRGNERGWSGVNMWLVTTLVWPCSASDQHSVSSSY